jgi:lysophospholipase L1-like esterase
MIVIVKKPRLLTAYACLAAVVLSAIAFADTPLTSAAKKSEKINPSLVDVKDVPGLPRVLLIGDSVSMGYTLPVRQLLAGKANVHRPPLNCHSSRQILAELDDYLGDKPWDVIHINCGGHDFSFRKGTDGPYLPPPEGKILVPLDEYKSNLQAIVRRLQQTKANIVWATTTPMSANYMQKGYRRQAELDSYNAAATQIMQEAKIPINDLYALTKNDAESLLKDGVHFTPHAYDMLAKAVAESIQKQLPPPKVSH